MDKYQMFRIATLLYSESEGIKKKTTVLKRVVEAALVELENVAMTVSEIEISIKNLYDITIIGSEIESIIDDTRNKNHFEWVSDNRELKIRLSQNRYELLSRNVKRSVAEYIDEYVSTMGLDISAKDIILGFFYDVCQRNIGDFKAIILGKNISNEEDFCSSLSAQQAEYINGFLQWDNPEKNDALMALQGYSLEYSMLTCDSNVLFGTRLGTLFSNKRLYIDTNIIYYCLGINGDEYRRVNEALLEKCMACNEQLYITRYTEDEFTNTLDHYIDEIQKYDCASVSRLNFRKYMHNQDIYLFYLEWKKTRKKFDTPLYFKRFLIGEYARWKQKYHIIVEKKAPYNEEDESNRDLIEEYCEAFPYKGKINYDAYNIYWVERKRLQNGNCQDFSTTADFILSPHKLIKRWDSSRKNAVPVIVTPTMWLTLLNRFISRSRDDYECFKNFISINVMADEPINNREFLCIVKAIEEVTEDLNQQETIIDEFVAQKFAYLDKHEEEEISLETVQEKTKEESRKLMDIKVSDLEEQVSVLTDALMRQDGERRQQKANNEDALIKKEEALAEKEKIVNEKNLQLEKAKSEKNKLIESQIQRTILHKRIRHVFYMAIATGALIWQLVDMFVIKNPNNYTCKIILELITGTVLENSISDVMLVVIPLIVSGVMIKIDCYFLKIFWKKEYIEEYKTNTRSKIEKELI